MSTGSGSAPPPATEVRLQRDPPGASWPTLAWATGAQRTGDPTRVDELVEQAFDPHQEHRFGRHRAVLVVQDGRIIAERYAAGTDATTTHLSWSVAKSVTHAAIGLAVERGVLDPTEPMRHREWSAADDPRGDITVGDLLEMRSGLRFVEDYVDDARSDCLEMLFGRGADDVAAYAASLPLEHPVGSEFNYSSGTTNILVRHLADRLGAADDPALRTSVIQDLVVDELFAAIGAGPVELRTDAAGTWVGSSYLYATARDYARFGLLYLRDGWWQGRRLLPEGWVDDARTVRSRDPDNGWWYGRHWWVRGDEVGTFWANGYEGQMVACVPALDVVVVRLGQLPTEHRPATEQWFFDLLDALGPGAV